MSVQMLTVKKRTEQNSFGALQRSIKMEKFPKKVGTGENVMNTAIEQVFISRFTKLFGLFKTLIGLQNKFIIDNTFLL